MLHQKCKFNILKRMKYFKTPFATINNVTVHTVAIMALEASPSDNSYITRQTLAKVAP